MAREYGMNRSERMVIRLSPGEWERVEALAKSRGMTFADLVRERMLEDMPSPALADHLRTLAETWQPAAA